MFKILTLSSFLFQKFRNFMNILERNFFKKKKVKNYSKTKDYDLIIDLIIYPIYMYKNSLGLYSIYITYMYIKMNLFHKTYYVSTNSVITY